MFTNRLKDLNALVTGATSGIGESCARKLAELGVNLILVARDETRLKHVKESLLAQNISVTTIPLDVREKVAVQNAMEKLLKSTPVHILINNAGLALGLDPLDSGSIEDWETMIDTNLKGLLYITRAILPTMRKANQGHIINLGSIAGDTAYPGGNVYCATKAGVHMLSRALNADLVDTAIRVSTIAPGAVDTRFSDIRFKGDHARAQAVYEGYEALHADDIADLAVYILNAPAHVNIQETLIMSTAQRNPYLLKRE